MKFRYLLLLTSILFLTACGGKPTTAEALPTVALDNGSTPAKSAATGQGGGVAASGIVVPARQAEMAFTQGGSVKVVNAADGDTVKTGQVLVELDNVLLQLDVVQAQRQLKELTSDASVAAAAQAVAAAQKTLEDTQDDADSLFFPRASDSLVDRTQGEIDLAKQALARAADAYRKVSRREDGDPQKAAALVAMTNAQLNLNSLVAKYNWYSGTPTATDAAIIQANLDAAKAALQEATWYLAALKGEQIPAEATGSKLSALEQTKNALEAAQDRLNRSRLVAPIDGTIITINIVAGEYAPPGQILLVISDVANLRVETTDLSERDVPKVEIGQQVDIFVEALGQNLKGHVTAISPVAGTLGGDVVYKTTIELDEQLPGLRAGMSVEVQFETK